MTKLGKQLAAIRAAKGLTAHRVSIMASAVTESVHDKPTKLRTEQVLAIETGEGGGGTWRTACVLAGAYGKRLKIVVGRQRKISTDAISQACGLNRTTVAMVLSHLSSPANSQFNPTIASIETVLAVLKGRIELTASY